MPDIAADTARTNNLQSLLSQLKVEVERSNRYRHDLAVAVICIDSLAELQQAIGTLAADAVLDAITNALKSTLAHKDFFACTDDRSFIAVLGEQSAAQAAASAQRIKDKIDSQTITYNWKNIKVSISIGLASYPSHGDEPDKLIASATVAAQFALSSGGNRIVIA